MAPAPPRLECAYYSTIVEAPAMLSDFAIKVANPPLPLLGFQAQSARREQ